MDKDCVAMLKRMYGGEDGLNKEDMQYGDLLANFFGSKEKGQDMLEAVDEHCVQNGMIKRM